mmetsp:Transcript_44666/g.126358  ORF Transcript_44666/g.126358 Transcript_44666/m.126358 type:complete len:312 (-) Transcript_44666:246-1181(-)
MPALGEGAPDEVQGDPQAEEVVEEHEHDVVSDAVRCTLIRLPGEHLRRVLRPPREDEGVEHDHHDLHNLVLPGLEEGELPGGLVQQLQPPRGVQVLGVEAEGGPEPRYQACRVGLLVVVQRALPVWGGRAGRPLLNPVERTIQVAHGVHCDGVVRAEVHVEVRPRAGGAALLKGQQEPHLGLGDELDGVGRRRARGARRVQHVPAILGDHDGPARQEGAREVPPGADEGRPAQFAHRLRVRPRLGPARREPRVPRRLRMQGGPGRLQVLQQAFQFLLPSGGVLLIHSLHAHLEALVQARYHLLKLAPARGV